MQQFTQAEEPRAEQVRVTPEELVEAMSALEARRERETLERSRTISIGEAINELGLQATPEELLAAVAATRAQRAKAEAAVQPRAHVHSPTLEQRRNRIAAVMLGFSLLTTPILLHFLTSSSPAPQLVPPTPVEVPARPSLQDPFDRVPPAPPVPPRPVVSPPGPPLDGVILDRDASPRTTDPAGEAPSSR